MTNLNFPASSPAEHTTAAVEDPATKRRATVVGPTIDTGPAPRRPVVLTALTGGAGLVLATAATVTAGPGPWWALTALVAVWSVAAVLVTARTSHGALGLVLGGVALLGGVVLAAVSGGSAEQSTPDTDAAALAAAVLPAALTHLALALPDGVLASGARRLLVAGAYLGAAALAVATAVISVHAVVAVSWIGVLGGVALAGAIHRYRHADARGRARLQWLALGTLLAAVTSGAFAGTESLLDWPPRLAVVALCCTATVPLATVASTFSRLDGNVDRLLLHAVVAAGLAAMVVGIYVVAVLGLARAPDESERPILVWSMVAAGLSAIAAFPVRRRLTEVANQWIYGEPRSPDEALRTFAGRMTRAVPMDELLLQLVESLRKNLDLTAAEVWTGSGTVLDRFTSVPHRPARRLALRPTELDVIARSQVQGRAWLQVWLPELLQDRPPDAAVRTAAIAHGGELLGLLVVERSSAGPPFSEEDARVLGELARQVGLALHNVRLDTALQASLAELRQRNTELQASRLRIVTAADESRRRIERDLHDGAQQHLVALAVKVGLVKQLLGADPATATQLLDELRGDVQATLSELRELAHGIYPPLLRDRGLAEGLRTSANRASIPTEVTTAHLGRYPSEVEAAVYFCCLEAMQNAGKHAGPGAQLRVTVAEVDNLLVFEVVDDGAGFDPAQAELGRGFENMRDRLGAIGGELVVDAAPGVGSRIVGRIPLPEDGSASR